MHAEENIHLIDDLIIGFIKGELTPEETAQLEDWLRQDISHKRYFDECCELWIVSKISDSKYRYNAQTGFWNFKQRVNYGKEKDSGTIKKKFTLAGRLLRYAAVIIIAFVAGAILSHRLWVKSPVTASSEGIYELSVPLGSRAQFSLSDGTTVTLNAGSTLTYDSQFGMNDRIVRLEGEGYFKVARDAGRPFIVQTHYLNVIALGTEFNVKAYTEDKKVETTLVNGSIRVESSTPEGDREVTVLEPNQMLTFYAGESVTTERREVKKEEKKPIQPVQDKPTAVKMRTVREAVNVEPVVSWKENRWIFERQTLSQIAVELERRFDVQITFESERLKTFRFTGVIIAEPIEQVLEVMSISAPISFKLKGRTVTLSENKSFEELNKNLYDQHE